MTAWQHNKRQDVFFFLALVWTSVGPVKADEEAMNATRRYGCVFYRLKSTRVFYFRVSRKKKKYFYT